MKRPLLRWLPDAVARTPAALYTKLLAAFLATTLLLIFSGGVSLAELGRANERAEDFVALQRKIAAYRQIQYDTTSQLYSVASALLVPDERTLEATLRQLNQFGYDLDRLQFVAKDEVELLDRVRVDYETFIGVVTEVVESIRAGKAVEGRQAQVGRAGPLAERLERLTNELVNKAEAEMVAQIDASQQGYVASRALVIAFAIGSIVLALALGYAISWSLIDPLSQMGQRLDELAAGDFTKQVRVNNRDEFGALAANLNHMSDELGRLYRQIEAANRHKSEFLASMSHELRTPLNAVIGFSEVLEERMFGDLNDKQAEYVGDIRTSGQHLLMLINDVLDLAKVEAGRMELELTDFDLRETLEAALMLVRERATRHGITLTLEAAEDIGGIVADERKLRQVTLNLLSNAVKFTPDGGRVSVCVRAVDTTIEIAVADTGIGIAPEDQAVVFEEFRQVGSDTGRKGEGTGLGLALAKRFVELHGGAIWVQSALGSGTTFTFSLPRRSARAEVPAASEAAGTA
jgi:signal transduction histidine kinase